MHHYFVSFIVTAKGWFNKTKYGDQGNLVHIFPNKLTGMDIENLKSLILREIRKDYPEVKNILLTSINYLGDFEENK